MPELTFTITNLTCEACVKMTTKILHNLPGVTDVSVDLATGAGHLSSTSPITSDEITKTLATKGYTAIF